MLRVDDAVLARTIASYASPIVGAPSDFDALTRRAGAAQLVMLGEPSHGTHEFYRMRALLTARLVVEHGFNAIAIEGDWPETWRVHRYVRGKSGDDDAVDALAGFRRFPQWMWRNADMLDFVGWLREENDRNGRGVGIYGLDLYSLHASIDSVLSWLDRVDPDAARVARWRYGCFEQFGENPQAYGYATSFDLSPSCEDDVAVALVELQRKRNELLARPGERDDDEIFGALQNAIVIKNAEQYYRAMFAGSVSSWNLRDRHMADTLEALIGHLGMGAKIVVWAHNSHTGDARATQMGAQGELNIGQLVRERHPGETFTVGFTTWSGTVTAASEWDAPAERKHVRPGLPGSIEDLLHRAGLPGFVLMPEAMPLLDEPRLQRAIGVIYRPDSERTSHYSWSRTGRQFDALVHVDVTRAVEPLEREVRWRHDELPETWPSGV